MENSVEGNEMVVDDNEILRKEYIDWINSGLSIVPSVVINNQTFRGDLERDAVLEGICAGFDSEKKARICVDETEKEKEKGGLTYWMIVLIVILCVGLIAAVLVMYRNWVKKELN